MQVRPGRGQAELVPGPVDQEQRRDLLYFPLHRHQPDQVPVEGIEDVVDVGRAPLVREGDRSVRWEQVGLVAVPAAPGRPAR